MTGRAVALVALVCVACLTAARALNLAPIAVLGPAYLVTLAAALTVWQHARRLDR